MINQTRFINKFKKLNKKKIHQRIYRGFARMIGIVFQKQMTQIMLNNSWNKNNNNNNYNNNPPLSIIK